MGEPFVCVAFVSNSSSITVYNNEVIEIVSIQNCSSPIPQFSWEYVFGLTRIIGLTFNDEKVQQLDEENLVKIVDGEGTIRVEKLNLLEISSCIFKEIRKIADLHLNLSAKMVVISVPDHFTKIQKELVAFAASCAGFDNVNILIETAALALELNSDSKKTIALCRFDEGNFTIAIISLAGRGPAIKMFCEQIYLKDEIDFELWKKSTKSTKKCREQIGPISSLEREEALKTLRSSHEYRQFRAHCTSSTFDKNFSNIFKLYVQTVNQIVRSKVQDIIKKSFRLDVRNISEVIDLTTRNYHFNNLIELFPNSSYKRDYDAMIRGLALHGWKLLTSGATNKIKELRTDEPKEDKSIDMTEESHELIFRMKAKIEELTNSLNKVTEINKLLKNTIVKQEETLVEQSDVNKALMNNLVKNNEEFEELKQVIEVLQNEVVESRRG